MHVISGKLPIQPHLLAYVAWKENLLPGEALDLDESTPIRLSIASYFTNQKSLAFDREVNLPGDYSARLHFALDLDKPRGRVGAYYISDARVLAINHLLAAFLNQEITDRVKIKMVFGRRQQDIIYEFLRELHLPEDLYDRLVKACYRMRTEKRGEMPFRIHEKRKQATPDLFL